MAKKPKKRRMTQSPAGRARERKAELRKKFAKGTVCFQKGVMLGSALYAINTAIQSVEDKPAQARRFVADAKGILHRLKGVAGAKKYRDWLGLLDWKKHTRPQLEKELDLISQDLFDFNRSVARRCGR